jgi:hypothetical protein
MSETTEPKHLPSTLSGEDTLHLKLFAERRARLQAQFALYEAQAQQVDAEQREWSRRTREAYHLGERDQIDPTTGAIHRARLEPVPSNGAAA